MAEYPSIDPEPADPRDVLLTGCAALLRATTRHIALPSKRVELLEMAERVEKLMREGEG